MPQGIRVEVNGQVLSQGGDVAADQLTDTTSALPLRRNAAFLPAAIIVGLEPGDPLEARAPDQLCRPPDQLRRPPDQLCRPDDHAEPWRRAPRINCAGRSIALGPGGLRGAAQCRPGLH